jgi:amidase
MGVRRLRREELAYYAQLANWTLAESEVDEYLTMTEAMFDSIDMLDAQPAPPPARADALRDPGRVPLPGEDPYNAVIRWCNVKAAKPKGPLAGKRFGLKDNVALAGVPLTFASNVVQPYICEGDSIVAERLINAGAEIVAKLNLESFAWSGGGETSSFGPILNPFDTTRTAAGSSGGSAAALFYDGIDITIGTDQGGSIRLPASWCGVLGLKPTHSLVPYVGIGAMDGMYDHVGPLTHTVTDMALTMDVIAGKHPDDFRQDVVPRLRHMQAVESAPDDMTGITVGVLKEGFVWDDMPGAPPGTKETQEVVRATIEQFRKLGATIVEVSVPTHLTGSAMMFMALLMGNTTLLRDNGVYYHARGARQSPELATALGKGLRTHGDHLPPTLKLASMLGEYLKDHYFGAHYAKAMNMAPAHRAQYDAAFQQCDVMVMPTATHYAHEVNPDASLSERVLRGWSMLGNTAPLDASGHPALSMPAAEADGLPVGVMVVGPTFSDAEVLRFARIYEKNHPWLPARAPRA